MKINDAIWDELEAENKRLKHVIWMQRNECGLLNTSLTQAEAELEVSRDLTSRVETWGNGLLAKLAERERMLRMAHKTAGGPERSMSYELWLADLRAYAEEGSGSD